MMLESANDAALALAEHISGSQEEFAKLMNKKASELGCRNTNFVNPHGLHDDNHFTTPYDLYLITKEALKNPKFKEIVATKSYKIMPTNKQPEIRYMNNHNKLIQPSKNRYKYADGVKTGYTKQAKYTFVGSASKDNMNLLVVVMKDGPDFYDSVKSLFDYGFDNYTDLKVFSANDEISQLRILGIKDSIPLYPKQDLIISVPKNKQPEIQKNIILNSFFTRITSGQPVGFIQVNAGDNFSTKIELLSKKDYTSSIYNLQYQKDGTYKQVTVPTLVFIRSLFTYLFIIFFAMVLSRGFIRKYKKRSRHI
jgi:D-alanyl-D-alanine carboxypeptidase